MEYMPFLMFRPEIPYSESINVAYLFLLKFFSFLENS